jgi:hypothetical protein
MVDTGTVVLYCKLFRRIKAIRYSPEMSLQPANHTARSFHEGAFDRPTPLSFGRSLAAAGSAMKLISILHHPWPRHNAGKIVESSKAKVEVSSNARATAPRLLFANQHGHKVILGFGIAEKRGFCTSQVGAPH